MAWNLDTRRDVQGGLWGLSELLRAGLRDQLAEQRSGAGVGVASGLSDAADAEREAAKSRLSPASSVDTGQLVR